MTTALQGWHPGEVKLQYKLGYADAARDKWQYVENAMREQHRIFHTSNLPFIPITTLDDRGRPWGSIAAGASGKIGFVKSPDSNTLITDVRLWDGEPLLDTMSTWLDLQKRGMTTPERFLTAGIGIEFSTRRRNKFAGFIKNVKQHKGLDYELSIQVTEALGNCPKYVNTRKFIEYPDANPSVAYQFLHMGASERLPDDVFKFITDADTVFIASIYTSSALTAEKYPSHAGMNARGGLPGFMRVRPSDSRTIVLPDYSGNQMLSSLGNIESTRLAGLTVISFTSGDVLYLTGTAQVLVGAPAFEIMPRQASITTIETTGYTFVRNALPIRQEPGTGVGRSPYSPKIKYLLEEPEALAKTSKGLQGRLISAVQFSSDIAIFRFEVTSQSGAKGLEIRPGQAIVLDFMDWIGPPVYRHMADNAPGSINDDRVRTWTVSSAHEDQDAAWFELTMREMKGGTVTGALFNILRQHPSNKWEHPVQIYTVKVLADIVGITGDFCMRKGPIRMLLVAGGIGVTPFLSMLTALADGRVYREGDVVLVLASREPELFLKLFKRSLYRTPPKIKIRLELFTSQDNVCTRGLDQMNVKTTTHKGRIQQEYWREVSEDRVVFICGPGGFGDAAVAGLRVAGVPNCKVYREGFF